MSENKTAGIPVFRLRRIASLSGHTDRVWCVAWSPCGRFLASAGSDRSVRLWARNRVQNSTPTPTITSDSTPSDSQGTAESEGKLRVQSSSSDASGGFSCVAVLDGVHLNSVRSVAWSACGELLASCSFDGITAVWESASSDQDSDPYGLEYDCIATLQGQEKEIKGVAWAPEGYNLATCGRDKTVWVWDGDPDNEFDTISVLKGHSQDIKYVMWSPFATFLLSCSYDNTIRVWTEEDDDYYCTDVLSHVHGTTVWQCALSPQSCVAPGGGGAMMVSVDGDGSLCLWADVNHARTQPSDDKQRSEDQVPFFNSLRDAVFRHRDAVLSSKTSSTDGDDDMSTVTGAGLGQVSSGGYSYRPRFRPVQVQRQTHTRAIYSCDWSPLVQEGLLPSGQLNGGFVVCGGGDDGLSVHALSDKLQAQKSTAISAGQEQKSQGSDAPSSDPDHDMGVTSTGTEGSGDKGNGTGNDASPPTVGLVEVARVPRAHYSDVNSVRWNPRVQQFLRPGKEQRAADGTKVVSTGLICASGGDDEAVNLWELVMEVQK